LHVRNLDPLAVTGQLAWEAATNVAWLALEKTQGQTPDLLSLSVNPGALQPGIHTGSLVVRSPTPGVVHAERIIPVVLEVKPGEL
jgi:hypothetical protein